MNKFLQWWRGLFSGRPSGRGPESPAELAATFKARYHSFRFLLAANNKALELMAEMEGAAAGEHIFGMSFVQSRCTAIGVAVYQMAKNLNELAADRYVNLFERLRDIQGRIDGLLAQRKPLDQGPLILPLAEIDRDWADQAGDKMANLGQVRNRLGLKVPPGFVISSAAYLKFFQHGELQEEINRLIQANVLERTDQLFALSSEIQQLITRAELPEELGRAIEEAYRRLEEEAGPGVTVSLRSSALGEDSAEASFAGQYGSQLNVRPENIIEAYKEVVASKYSPQAMHYRLVRGLRDEDVAMCVGCLAMVEARAGGVAYSRNPLDLRDRSLQITSAWGLPKAVVDGNTATDLFVVERADPPRILERRIAHKESKFICYPAEGVCRTALTNGEADLASLSDEQVLALAGLVSRLEQHYGSPQDVEWAVAQDGSLVILQCRPLRPASTGPGEARPSIEGARALLSGGVRVSPGVAAGPVYWVRKNSDALGFPRGAVLVVPQPLPRWAALLGEATAVIARQGSAAGHLATMAREYGLPALFGLGEAAESLGNGELVTVDADGLAVYQGRVDSLLAEGVRKRSLMAGSPVFQTLKGVLELVTPLTLVDPDAPTFKTTNCQTLHDITRFCHEKSVQEMFSFGQEHHFPERSSKQLFHQVPMQWWIINLDDGFNREVEDKYVTLDNVASIPMLALWEGMTRVPWEGPPAVSGGGLASVLFQATANPALVSPFKSPYANRNYFMISRNFLNLQSRFGFHFSAVESLVGERQRDNYVSLFFKGGAADFERRLARVRFLGEVLEEHDFRVEIKEDTAFARLEGLDQAAMVERLKVVGYLIMHTRQLDMIMSSPESVSYYRSKIRSDLETLLSLPEPGPDQSEP